jgi:SAM-dependent methyltransferase
MPHRTAALLRECKLDDSAEDLGLGLPPGEAHYRAYVGPPASYDLIAATTFSLLAQLGLRQHHKVLDIGCGSLRIGRLLIPYLNVGHYVGIEPNRWLVEAGIAHEVGADQVRIKLPRFHFAPDAGQLAPGERFDFALAQSIFSHCGTDLILAWLRDVAGHLADDGVLAATFVPAPFEPTERGWIYPDCIGHPSHAVAGLAAQAGLEMHLLAWPHPRQRWAVFARPGVALRMLHPGLLLPAAA